MQLSDFRATVDPAFGDAQNVVGNAGSQFNHRVQADLKRAKITAVYADNVRAAIQGALQFIFVVDFTEGIQVQSAGIVQ